MVFFEGVGFYGYCAILPIKVMMPNTLHRSNLVCHLQLRIVPKRLTVLKRHRHHSFPLHDDPIRLQRKGDIRGQEIGHRYGHPIVGGLACGAEDLRVDCDYVGQAHGVVGLVTGVGVGFRQGDVIFVLIQGAETPEAIL